METFFLAETLKYLFLIFSDVSVVPLNGGCPSRHVGLILIPSLQNTFSTPRRVGKYPMAQR